MLLLAAALAALAVVGLAPSKAVAGCGDGVGSLHLMNQLADEPAPATEFPDRPCDGPECQRGSVPPLPSVPTAPPSAEEWSCLPAFLTLLHPTPSMRMIEPSFDCSGRVPNDIFHPPRISSL